MLYGSCGFLESRHSRLVLSLQFCLLSRNVYNLEFNAPIQVGVDPEANRWERMKREEERLRASVRR